MKISEVFSTFRAEGRIPFSFEFSPPKTEAGWQKLYTTITQLKNLGPASVSVTYGAGGSTRENTHQLVTRLNQDGFTVVAHLTCEGSTRQEINKIIDAYDQEGIQNILALKGDVPKDHQSELPDFHYASDLVTHIRQRHPSFGIGVAGFPEGHPDCRNRLSEMDFLKAKVDAGADYIVTQLFFDNHDFLDFSERCQLAGIKIPIIAGIMPITTLSGMKRMAELAARARFPARLLKSLSRATTPEAVAEIGVHWASEQIDELLHYKVDGIHLYTLNDAQATLSLCRQLGLADLRTAR